MHRSGKAATCRCPVTLLMPNFEAGGAERVMIRLAQGLVDDGFPVDLVVLSESGPYRQELDPRVRVVSLQATRAWRAIPSLARYLRQQRPRAVLSALFHCNFLAVAARALAQVPTRVVLSEHNTLELVQNSVGPVRWLVFQWGLRIAYPRADAVVCVSNGIAQGLIRALPSLQNKLHVINNPVVTENVLALSQERLIHPWLDDDQCPLILAAGRLIDAKGFDVLVAAMPELLARVSARLVILGQGPMREALLAQVQALGLSDRVSLPGFTNNPYAWMSRCRVFVLSSRHEGLPGALIEAMACGSPVVATDCPHGPNEILENGKWGRLVPVNDPAALAEAIAATIKSDAVTDVRSRAWDYGVPQASQAYARALQLETK